jgi:hypothetical protein
VILKKAHIASVWPQRHEFHVLTYAEEGFAPLNEHTKSFCIEKENLVSFADEINARNESGSLHPLAPVSAVPRVLLRDQKDASALCLCIEEFYKINAVGIHARKVLLDFRTPNVERFVQLAVEMSLRSEEVNFIDELIVIDDHAI